VELISLFESATTVLRKTGVTPTAWQPCAWFVGRAGLTAQRLAVPLENPDIERR
jgi:hypothetical protein